MMPGVTILTTWLLNGNLTPPASNKTYAINAVLTDKILGFSRDY